MKKVLILGNLPPPAGGVSVFLANLVIRLKIDGHHVDIIEPKAGKRALFLEASNWRKIWNSNVCLINIKGPLRIAIILMLNILRVRTVLVQHNLRDSDKWQSIIAYCLANTVVFVNGEAERKFRSSFFSNLTRISLIPAFVRTGSAILTNDKYFATSAILENFRSKNNLFFVTYANFNSDRIKLHNGKDLYGIDLVLDAYEEHLKRNGNAQCPGLLILDPLGGGYRCYRARVQQICSVYGDCLMYQTTDVDMRAVFKVANAYLRWTLTDGDSVAIREALDEGCPVVASSVCERPHGCKVVNLENFEELVSVFSAKLTRSHHGHDYYESWCDVIFELKS